MSTWPVGSVRQVRRLDAERGHTGTVATVEIVWARDGAQWPLVEIISGQGRGWGEAARWARQGRQLRGVEPRGPGDHREGPGGESASWAGPDPAGGSGRARLPGPLSKRPPAPALRADPLGCGPAVTSSSGWTGRRPRLGAA